MHGGKHDEAQICGLNPIIHIKINTALVYCAITVVEETYYVTPQMNIMV